MTTSNRAMFVVKSTVFKLSISVFQSSNQCFEKNGYIFFYLLEEPGDLPPAALRPANGDGVRLEAGCHDVQDIASLAFAPGFFSVV